MDLIFFFDVIGYGLVYIINECGDGFGGFLSGDSIFLSSDNTIDISLLLTPAEFICLSY